MYIEPLDKSFGATVTGVDLATISSNNFRKLHAAWLDFALLVFPDQHLTKSEQIAFAKRFGPLELECTPISNVTKDGSIRGDDDVMKILKGNMDWHCDSTYLPVMAKGAVFSAHTVPEEGGETGWADMRAAFQALSQETRNQVLELTAYHSLHHSQAKIGHKHTQQSEYSGYGFDVEEPPLRPLVKIHPETSQPSLVIGRHAYGIPGLSEIDSKALLTKLLEDACQAERVHYHRWRPGDMVLWDNRCLLHRACPWDVTKPRIMFHSRIAGDPVTESSTSN